MKNVPFRFTASEGAVSSLLHELEKLGLVRTSVEESYLSEVWSFTQRASAAGPVEIRWSRTNWPDGMHEEDSLVSIHRKGVEAGQIVIYSLLKAKLSCPLRQEVSKRILSLCSLSAGHA
jgi:hypothetical protein